MTNVFLRSTRRQPVRTAFLLVVTALITFAFVARGAEYLVVKQETERLAGYYRSIGAVPVVSSIIINPIGVLGVEIRRRLLFARNTNTGALASGTTTTLIRVFPAFKLC